MNANRILSFATSLLFVVTSAFAQSGPGGDLPGMDLSFVKLFGEKPAFTANTDVKITDPSGKETMSMSVNISLLGQNMRLEVDMSNMNGGMVTPQAIAQMKQMGMDQTINISRPDKKTVCLIFPNMKSYAIMPIPESTLQSLNSKDKIEKTEIGRETIDSHPCVKNKVTVTDDKGKTREFTLWNATDLKDFPIQFQTTERGQIVTSTYKNIKFAKPEEKQFDPPSGYKKYDDMQQLMMSAMQKMLDPRATNPSPTPPSRQP